MHNSDSYLQSINKADLHQVLSAHEANALNIALQADACNFFQCSAVSFVDAIRSLESGFYTWAVVKLYYSVFYALRSRLALSGECIFYKGRSPLSIMAAPGSASKKARGNTHEVVLKRFKETHPGDYFLSQDIGGEDALAWFIAKREEANYTKQRFAEPSVPPYLEGFIREQPRKSLGAYAADSVYVFDEDHAAVAFPFALLIDLRKKLITSSLKPLLSDEIDFLRHSLKDPNGPLGCINFILC